MTCVEIGNYNSTQRGYTLTSFDIFLISSCVFQRLTTFDFNGGVIFANSSLSQFSIMECNFFNCSSNMNGGCFYLIVLNITLDKNSFFQCWSLLYGQYFYCSSNNILKNYLFFLKNNNSSIGYSILFSFSSNFNKFTNSNISSNLIKENSGFYFNSNLFSFYNNFFNNSIHDSSVLFLLISNFEIIFKNTIFQENKCQTYLIFIDDHTNRLEFINCIFQKNEKSFIYLDSILDLKFESNQFIDQTNKIINDRGHIVTYFEYSFFDYENKNILIYLIIIFLVSIIGIILKKLYEIIPLIFIDLLGFFITLNYISPYSKHSTFYFNIYLLLMIILTILYYININEYNDNLIIIPENPKLILNFCLEKKKKIPFYLTLSNLILKSNNIEKYFINFFKINIKIIFNENCQVIWNDFLIRLKNIYPDFDFEGLDYTLTKLIISDKKIYLILLLNFLFSFLGLSTLLNIIFLKKNNYFNEIINYEKENELKQVTNSLIKEIKNF